MKQVHLTTPSQWRQWLAENHDKETGGIWLVFHRKAAGKPSLGYEDSVEEALCFGWIDSTVRRIDDAKYCRKFTPRRNGSVWSNLNKQRVAKMVREGKMTEFGQAKIDAAKASGRWQMDVRPAVNQMPRELSEALARNGKASDFFKRLAPSCRKRFIGWIATAKKPETRAKRVKETVALLARGEKLGLM
jgi:uncharacterized protein YdeI (YjbR/CyaY-like superfamily)